MPCRASRSARRLTIIEPKLGLFFGEDAPAYCFECRIYHLCGRILVFLYLCKREQARVAFLSIIPGYAAKFVYPATDDIDAIARDAASQFWARALHA